MPMVTAPVSESLTVRAKPNWWRSPQRVWLRRAIFQIHLWAGVALSVYAVVIGLSGSALVFEQEIDDWQHPYLRHLQPQPSAATMEATVRNIETERPGWRGVGLEDFGKRGRAIVLSMQNTSGATSESRLVSFNPYTGQVLLDRMRYAGVLGWLASLHYYLLAGKTGLLVSGWMAVGLLLLCVTGLILWWPGVRRWASALVLRRRSRWQRTNWDLHVVIGFWSCALLSAVTFTGVYFAFPGPVRNMIVFVTGGHARPLSKPREAPTGTVPSPVLLTIDQAIAAARQALPDAPPNYLFLPDRSATKIAAYSATGYYPGTTAYSQLVQVTIDNHSGAVLARADTRQDQWGVRMIQYFFAVHAGLFGGAGAWGIAVKTVWVALGITPALLAVTGLIMYWNRKLRPLWGRLRSS